MVTIHSVTPGQLKNRGAGLTIGFGIHPSPFGECLLAMTERGICWLSFIDPNDRQAAIAELAQQWRAALLQERPEMTRPVAERIFPSSRPSAGAPATPSIDLFVQGTNFQINVWEALLTIPPGSVASYEEMARRIGAPTATRAVASAIARNPVSFLIPCHRVIRKSGAFGNYRWGAARKKALLGWETARFQAEK